MKIDKFIPNREQCRTFDKKDIQKLAENFKENGQIEPIIVRRLENKKFECCKGHGIIEAIKCLGEPEPTVKAIIRDISKDEGAEIALISNLNRKELSSIDRENHIYRR